MPSLFTNNCIFATCLYLSHLHMMRHRIGTIEALPWVLGNRGTRAFISGEQENEDLKMRGTREQMHFGGNREQRKSRF